MNSIQSKTESMVLYIDATSNTPDQPVYNVNLSGKYRIQLVGVSAYFTNSPTIQKIVIRSPSLLIPYGNQNYPFVVYPFNFNDSSYKGMFNYERYFDGTMTLKIVDPATGATPTDFQFMYLTFEIEKLN